MTCESQWRVNSISPAVSSLHLPRLLAPPQDFSFCPYSELTNGIPENEVLGVTLCLYSTLGRHLPPVGTRTKDWGTVCIRDVRAEAVTGTSH